jgi:MFS family permease
MQALTTVNAVVLATVNGLVGLAIAPDPKLATIPVSAYVLGGALSTFGASMLMARWGRQRAFVVGISCGIVGSLVCAYAAHTEQFWLLCAGSLIIGIYGAFSQYHRFAAADVAPPDFLSRAVSLVLAAGVVGAVLGPESAKLTRDLAAKPYVGSYLLLTGVGLLALVCVSRLQVAQTGLPDRRLDWAALGRAARSVDVGVAVLSGVVGYAVMLFLMTATPLAMQHEHHHFDQTALVIEWHVLGMFAPSFVTGSLIKRWGVLRVIVAGSLLMLLCAGVNLSGVSVAHFWSALVLLGVGWNFMFVGGTTLLSEAGQPSEKAMIQGTNELLVYVANAVASFSAGLLLDSIGWQAMNQVALPFLLLTLGACALLARRRLALQQAVTDRTG